MWWQLGFFEIYNLTSVEILFRLATLFCDKEIVSKLTKIH